MRIFKVAISGKPEIGCRESKIHPPDAVVTDSPPRAPAGDYARGRERPPVFERDNNRGPGVSNVEADGGFLEPQPTG